MKLLLTCMLALAALIVSAQKKYHCEYKETLYMTIPDSALDKMRSAFEAQGLPASMVKQLLDEFKSQMMSSSSLRIVEAAPDTTIITVRPGKPQDGGNIKLTMKIQDETTLFIKGELYVKDSASKKYTRVTKDIKKYNPVDEKKIILGYTCKKYRSEDSTVIAWVAADLPSYINPGISLGGISGAVLGFELKGRSSATIAEAEKIQ